MACTLQTSGRFILGTANFGLNYGIKNQSGRLCLHEVNRILERALCNGIDILDTAIAYGNSEARLGEIGVSDFKVISKVSDLAILHNKDELFRSVETSIRSLRIEGALDGLLIHFNDRYYEYDWSAVAENLNCLQNAGFVDDVGVSIYGPSNLGQILHYFEPQIIQAPYNVFDHRIADWIGQNPNRVSNCLICIRSIFLQGLLLLNKDDIPITFSRWQHHFDAFHAHNQKVGASALDVCLSFAKKNPMNGKIVVGVDSASQLTALVEHNNLVEYDFETLSACTAKEPLLIDPYNWDLK